MDACAPNITPAFIGGRAAGAARAPMRLGRRWLMLFLTFLIYSVANADRSTISIAAPLISSDLHLSAVQMGLIFSAFGWAYGAFALPAGLFVDKLGAKLALLVGLISWSIGTFLNGFAGEVTQAFAFLCVARFFIGAAESVVTPGSARILATWFPDRERGMASSLWASSTYLSTAVAAPMMGWICYVYGWEPVFWAMGVLGLIAGVVWMIVYRPPATDPRISPEEFAYIAEGGAVLSDARIVESDESGPAKAGGWRERLCEIRFLLSTPQLLVIFFGQYCGNTIALFLLTWMPTYLVKARGYSILEVGFLMSLAGIAGGIAAISGGYMVDLIYRKTGSMALSRKASLTLGYLLTSSMVLLIFVQSSAGLVVMLCVIFLGKGWCNTGWMLVADSAPKSLVGTVGGLLNAIGSIGSTLSSIVIGYVVQETGSFDLAICYVAAHGLFAVTAFWLVLRNMKRVVYPG
jgi:ACS family glucarate transporter-like MFS transporter